MQPLDHDIAIILGFLFITLTMIAVHIHLYLVARGLDEDRLSEEYRKGYRDGKVRGFLTGYRAHQAGIPLETCMLTRGEL